MKEVYLSEGKHGVVIHVDDADNIKRQELYFTWREITGLYWGLKRILDHPSFNDRDPRPIERMNGNVSSRKVIHEVVIEDGDSEPTIRSAGQKGSS